MKKLLLIAMAGLLGACGLFRKIQDPPVPDPIEPPPISEAFQVRDIPWLEKAVFFNYRQYPKSGDSLYFSVFPLNDSMVDLMTEAYSIRHTINPANRQRNTLELVHADFDSTLLSGGYIERLPAKAFNELLMNWRTELEINGAKYLFRVVKTRKNEVALDDSLIGVEAVEIHNPEMNWSLKFIPNRKYPLIIYRNTGDILELEQAVSNNAVFDDFEMKVGSQLQYSLTNYGIDRYDVVFTPKVLKDTLMIFGFKGKYEGEFAYPFEGELIYRQRAAYDPGFEVLVFSASITSEEQDHSNFVVFSKGSVDNIVKTGFGPLKVEHIATDPSQIDSADYSPEDYYQIIRDWMQRFVTDFELRSMGRINEWPFLVRDNVNNEENYMQLPATELNSVDGGINMKVYRSRTYPILMYYSDPAWEIQLLGLKP